MPMSNSFKRRLFPQLPEIIERFGTPFHIYDVSGILRTGWRMKRAFRNTPYRQYYAVKALTNPNILQILFEELGFGFDCSSVPELKLARGVGALDEDIMFTSNNTSQAEFEEALGKGGCLLNLDDLSLVHEVPHPFPNVACFRINPGKARTGNSIIGNPHDAKYGITLKQVVPAYQAAINRGATRFGLHTMVCSNELRASYMVETTRMLLGLCVKLKQKLDIECEFINIGGGFGIPYRPSQEELKLEWMADRIVRQLEQFERAHGWRPKLLTECGRYPTGPHGVLVTAVINEKRIYRRYVGVDANTSTLPRHAVYGAYHHAEVLDSKGRIKVGRRARMSVVDGLCENCGRFATERLLPASTAKGDLVVMEDTGAHCLAMGSMYNFRGVSQELMLLPDGSVERIRRAVQSRDMFSTIRLPKSFLSHHLE